MAQDVAQRETAVDLLVRRISARIVDGAFGPGVRLDEQTLAETFAVSRTPVREALARLAAHGLVERRPHRGVVVACPSIERLEHLFELMCELEGVCARLAALRMTAEERASLRDAHLCAGALARAGDVDGYADANRRFHLAIYAGAHNPALVETTRDVRIRLAPFRRAQFDVPGRLALSWAEHDAVVAALLAGEADAAGAAMRAHIRIVKDAYRAYAGCGQPDGSTAPLA